MSLQIPENTGFLSSDPPCLLFGPASIESGSGALALEPQTYRLEQVTNQDGTRNLRLMKRVLVNDQPVDVLCASW